jgi:hypothetical protein
MFPRLDELFTLMTPDRQANMARWNSMRPDTTEAKNVILGQKTGLSNYLASAGLPSTDKTPRISPAGGQVGAGTSVTLSCAPGWKVYFTLDGSDPRLSLNRQLYTAALNLQQTATLKAAAMPTVESPAGGNWTDLATVTFTVVPRPEISIFHSTTGLTLTWPAAFTNQALESLTSPGGTWIELPVTPALVGDHYEVDQTFTDTVRFYRLRTK